MRTKAGTKTKRSPFHSGGYRGAAASKARAQFEQEERQRAFVLNDAQYEFVYDDAAKFVAYIGGIGAGKSFAGAVKALRNATEQPGSLGLIGAPTYPMLRDATIRSVFDIFPPALIKSWNKTDGLLTLTNGSEIIFRSTDDPDKLRGPNLAWFWLDEGPLCGYAAWRIMKGRLRQQGFTQQGWITGTPHGEDDFWEDFEHEPRPNHRLYRASTRDNAHNLPDCFIEDLGYTGQFAQQEIEGLFVSFEGLVYEFRSEWHMGEWNSESQRATRRIGGVDWGFTNPSVALPLFVDGSDRVYVLDEFYQRNVGFTGDQPTVGMGGVSKAILGFTRQYGIQTWYCGPDEPGNITQLNALFARERLQARAIAANDEIVFGIQTVRQHMALRGDGTTGLKLSAKCAQTRSEFRTYSYPPTGERQRGKRDPQDKPLKSFDHAMDALRYALHSALGHAGMRSTLDREQIEATRQPVTSIGGVKILRKTF